MTCQVRPLAAGDDLAEIGAVVQKAYFALPGYPRDDEYDQVLGDVVGRAGDLDTQVVVAVDDGRIVGCLTFLPDPLSEHVEFDDPESAGFRYFGVDPAVQGRGVGEAMVQWCIEEARRLGRRRLRIHTLQSMPGAQRLYRRVGFERDPQFDENWGGIIGLSYVLHL